MRVLNRPEFRYDDEKSIFKRNPSKLLLYTNPKLTTNVKLVVDSADNLYLESFNANRELSSSDYKNFKVDPNSSYSKDVSTFWSRSATPSEFAYLNFTGESIFNVKNTFDNQFNGFYTSGASYLNSPYYSEKFSYFAPLKLGDILPDYFIICKIKDAASYSLVKDNLADITSDQVRTGIEFKSNILDKLDIIKTYDLSSTNLGTYISNHFYNLNRPYSPIFASFKRDSFTKFRGIDFVNGGFIEKSEYLEDVYRNKDLSIMEFEYLITSGFERNSVIDSSIINLEFLFDDDSNEWEAGRYVGFYVSEVKESSLKFDRSDYFYQLTEKYQTIDKKGSIITNKNGVNLRISSNVDITGIPTFNQISEQNSIFYIKDKDGDFYSLSRKNAPKGLNNIRITSTSIDYDDIDTVSRQSIPVKRIENITYSKSHIVISDVKNFVVGDKLVFKNDNNLDFEFIVSCSSIAPIGSNKDNHFNPNGSEIDVCDSLVSAINFDSQSSNIFRAVRSSNSVIVYSKFNGSLFNLLKVELQTIQPINPLIIGNGQNDYVYFVGGAGDNFKSFLIEGIDSNFVIAPGDLIKTKNGFSTISFVSSYLDESNLSISSNLLVSVLTDDQLFFNSTGDALVYKEFSVDFGRFNIFPLSYIDSDFYSEQYSLMGELDVEKHFYDDVVDDTFVDQSSYPAIRDFYSNGGFNTLYPLQQNDDTSIKILSEYDRLLENYVNDLSTVSRISPYISKWVASRSAKDVRDNPYRLNISDAFSILNFSPDIKTTERNPSYFTHEWYCIINAPEYFKDNNTNIWSYLNYNGSNLVNDLLSDSIDNFTDIFRNNSLDFTYEVDEKNATIQYSLFRNGSADNFPYTFFRGSKVSIKEREDSSTKVNFNIDFLRLRQTDKYNGYRFSSAVYNTSSLQRGIYSIVNDVFKFVVILIVINIEDEILLPDGKVDRTILYSLNHSIEFEEVILEGQPYKVPLKIGSDFVYKNIPMEGAIDPTNSFFDAVSGHFTIIGMPDINGVISNFERDIKIGANGKFNSIELVITSGSNPGVYEFKDIVRVFSSNKFTCKTVLRDGSPITMPILSANIELDFQQGEYSIIGGGFNYYNSILDDISYGSICNKFNLGYPEVNYLRTDINGNIVQNDYIIEFNQLDEFLKASYLTITADENKPSIFSSIDVIGYNLAVKSNYEIYPYFRYTGSYDIKTVDIVTFNQLYFTEEDEQSYRYKVKILTKFLNCNFKIDESTGVLNNWWYYKASSSKDSDILQLIPNSGYRSVYPLIGEISIDKNSYNVFQSQWDPYFYFNYLDKNNFEEISGTFSSKVENSFMSPVLLNLPNNIEDISVLSSDVSLVSSSISTIINANLKASIFSYIKSKLKSYFEKWINPIYSDTFNSSIDEFLNNYIEKNIMPLYRISSTTFYSKQAASDSYTEDSTQLLLDRSFRIRYLDMYNIELINNKINGQNFTYSIKINMTRI